MDKETLRDLTSRRDGPAFRQLGIQLLLTLATGIGAYLVYQRLPWPFFIPAFFVHATVYSFLGLSGAGHELCHGTPFKTRFWNELFLKIVAFLSWTDYVFFRASHAKHHQYTVFAGLDGEVVLPMGMRRRDWFYLFTFSWPGLKYVFLLTVRRAAGRIEGDWERRLFPESDVRHRRELINWARVMLAGHTLLAGAFLYFHQWILLLLVTLAPFFCGWLNFLCGFTQHVGLQPNVPDFRLCCRTVLVPRWVAFLYWQMNYHVEHHMYAAVPFYKLAALRRVLEADLPAAYPGLRAAWKDMLAIMRRQKVDPNEVLVPALPSRST